MVFIKFYSNKTFRKDGETGVFKDWSTGKRSPRPEDETGEEVKDEGGEGR